jgi:hypothetical protein
MSSAARNRSIGIGVAAGLVVALLVVLGIVALGGGDDDESADTTIASTLAPETTTAPVTTVPATTLPATTVASTSTTTSSTTSTSSTSTTTTTTSTTLPAAAALVLRPTGLGNALFGADPDEVIDYVTQILGPSTADSGWADPLSSFGVCPGTEVRGVTWGDLTLLFGDESWAATGRRHFFNYVYGPPLVPGNIDPAGPRTDSGVKIGDTVAQLRAAYPSVQVFPGEEIFGPSFIVEEHFTGFLTGVGNTDTVISFIGGQGCGE